MDNHNIVVVYKTGYFLGIEYTDIKKVNWNISPIEADKLSKSIMSNEIDTGKYSISCNYTSSQYMKLINTNTNYLSITCFLLDLAFGSYVNECITYSPQRITEVVKTGPNTKHEITFTERMHKKLCKKIRKLIKEKYPL